MKLHTNYLVTTQLGAGLLVETRGWTKFNWEVASHNAPRESVGYFLHSTITQMSTGTGHSLIHPSSLPRPLTMCTMSRDLMKSRLKFLNCLTLKLRDETVNPSLCIYWVLSTKWPPTSLTRSLFLHITL